MTNPVSMLVISRDAVLVGELDASRQPRDGLSVQAELGSLSQLNGQAIRMATGKDLIVVQTDGRDPEELAAIRTLTGAVSETAEVVALADGSASLSDVLALNQAGIGRVLPVPASAEELLDELDRLGPARRQRRLTLKPVETHRGQIIATVPARGGIGGTTLSVNLAERLAAPRGRGKNATRARVALIDLDLQFGSVGSMLDLAESDAIARLASEGTEPDDTLLRQSMLDHDSGLRVLPAPVTFVPPDALRAEQVAAMLDSLRADYDYIVIDLPHTVVGWMEPVVARADALLLLMDTAVPSVRQARRLIDLLSADRLTVPVKVIVNRERKPLFGSATRREAEKALERKVWAWLPPDPKHARAAIDQGRPLHAVGGPLASAVAKMAALLQSELAAAAASERT